MFPNKNEFDITDGLKTVVLKMVDNAIKNSSIESFYEIDGFIVKILNLSISNKYYLHFKDYIDVSIFYYTLSYGCNEKNNVVYNKIFDACSDRAARRIRESFLLLDYLFEESEHKYKKVYNRFKLAAFTAFSQLLYEQVKRKDNKQFEFTLNQLGQVFLGKSYSMLDFAFKLKRLENNNLDELSSDKEHIESFRYFQHTILGIKYWLYSLYENNIIDSKELRSFLTLISRLTQSKRINPEFFEIELLFNNLNSRALDWYLNWQSWDFEVRTEGEAYFMNSPMDWIFKGVIIDAIQQNSFSNTFYIDCNIIEKQNPQNKSLLIHTLKEKIEQVKHNSKWIEYFSNNIDTQKIETQLNQINASFEIQRTKEIVKTNLIPEKIESFKDNFYKGWDESKFTRKIFEYFNRKKLYAKEDKKMFIVGASIFLEKGKSFFIEDSSNVFGIDAIANDYGKKVSFAEDRFFFETVLRNKQEKIYDSIETGLNKAIENLTKLKAKPSAIFIDSTQAYLHLISTQNEKWNNNKKVEFSDGTYDGIPVFYVIGNLLQNRFIVADFKKAFTMLYRKLQSKYNNELRIDIKEVSDELANEKLKTEQNKWKNINGQLLSDEDALDYIKTSILIDYEVVNLFEINNENAFEIGILEK